MLHDNSCEVAWLMDCRKNNKVICRVNRTDVWKERYNRHRELVLYMIVVQTYYIVYDRSTRVLYVQ